MQSLSSSNSAALRIRTLLLASVALHLATSPLLADEDDSAQRIPSSARDLYSPSQRSFEPQAALPGGPHQNPRGTGGDADDDSHSHPVLMQNLKQRLQYSDPFFRDMVVDLYARTHYLRQDNANLSRQQAWAGGGAVSLRTGFYRDFLQFEIVGATSQPLYAPSGEGGTLLLTEQQAEVSALSVANARMRFLGQELTTGRQLLKTPYVNPYDTRMIPNTVEGVVLTRQRDKSSWLDYGGGYLWGFKARDSSYFVSFSNELGIHEDRGMLFGGLKLTPVDGLTIGGFNYLIPDVLNTAFAEADWLLPTIIHEVDFRLSVNYTNQQSVGSRLMRGGDFSASQISARAAASYANATGYVAFSNNGKSDDLVNPFGSFPAYTNMDQMHFNEAGQTAIVGGISYDFSELVADGLKFAVLYGNAYGIIDPATGAPRSDQRELDIKLEYLPKSGPFADTHLMFIYSDVQFPENRPGERRQQQFHGALTYLLPTL
ncbi:OprD family outer membrane porin [Hyphomicrobium sulfonivorans]|uniref:OprD family outer membrane porin n=1 Tax=Hyphomicrobium sulfonivorans TaxID=121290 RepID=UPI001AEDBBCF|nr:OprD family outer membrane porin [Hyphomicrobium sulfonivorans]NSL70533.1 hypothetical protein [Hyphomicrobium sulfonivorans]